VSVDLSTGQVVDMGEVKNVEHVIGTFGADSLVGNDLDNIFVGVSGQDTVQGGAGFDRYVVGNGPAQLDSLGFEITIDGPNLQINDGTEDVFSVTLAEVDAVYGSMASDRVFVVNDSVAGWEIGGSVSVGEAAEIFFCHIG